MLIFLVTSRSQRELDALKCQLVARVSGLASNDFFSFTGGNDSRLLVALDAEFAPTHIFIEGGIELTEEVVGKLRGVIFRRFTFGDQGTAELVSALTKTPASAASSPSLPRSQAVVFPSPSDVADLMF